MKEEIENLNLEIEDLAVQLTDMLEVALYFAGVKKDKLQDASEAYIESLDEFYVDDDPEMNADEIIKAIKHFKNKKPEFFIK